MAAPAAGLVEARSFDSLLAGRKIAGLQVFIIIICAIISMVDGFDTQSIALAAPSIAKDFGVAASSFGPIFGIGLFGGLVGAIVFGLLGDKFGR
jgi:AAHS family 4-hydroxybenzoate transporter-like MFS transporter